MKRGAYAWKSVKTRPSRAKARFDALRAAAVERLEAKSAQPAEGAGCAAAAPSLSAGVGRAGEAPSSRFATAPLRSAASRDCASPARQEAGRVPLVTDAADRPHRLPKEHEGQQASPARSGQGQAKPAREAGRLDGEHGAGSAAVGDWPVCGEPTAPMVYASIPASAVTNPVLLTPPKLAPPLVRPASPSSPQSGEEGDKEFDRGDGDNYIDLDHPEGRRRREAARARRAEASDKHLSDLRRAHPGGIPGPSAVDKARARALRLSQC